MVRELEELKDKILTEITVINDEEILFICNSGETYRMYHEQDCCEYVSIEDIVGDLSCLLNNPIVIAEEVTETGTNEWGTYTWTFYKFATVKGYVTIRWYGESNGYYSEGVDIEKVG
ncbi:hypothetical protein SCB17_003087 [Clostridium perfringens]|nr:hypothetical protein [Clostridium perfringens]